MVLRVLPRATIAHMGSFKVGAVVALAFVSGGGMGAYFFSSPDSEETERRLPEGPNVFGGPSPSSMTESAPSATRIEHSPAAVQLADAVAAEMDEQDEGRSAAEILWALERAYQDQERRIRLLEATLEESSLEEELVEEDLVAEELEDEVATSADDELSHATHDDSEEPTVQPQLSSTEAPLDQPEPIRVTLVDERLERMEASAPADPVPSPVVVLNHFQPIYFATQTTEGPTPREQSSPPRMRQNRWVRSSIQQRSTRNQSWVASGFDVYTKR